MEAVDHDYREADDRDGDLPDRLGEFSIAGVLGAGGSSTVYDARWGHREVALKVFHASLSETTGNAGSVGASSALLEEAERLTRISHPNVVKALACGVLPDGRSYLAMEKLVGETLAERIAGGAVGLDAALRIFAQLADAVSALHASGILHRDIKPENVGLVGGGEHVVLLDLGIAKVLEQPATTVTREGLIRGTPAYMAPERFFGQACTVASEVYELAVTLYCTLTAALPWADPTSADQRLLPRAGREVGVALPPAIEGVLLAALSTRPEKRPASVEALRARIAAAALAGAAHVGSARVTSDIADGAALPPARWHTETVTPYERPARDQELSEQGRVVSQVHATSQRQRGSRLPWLFGLGLVLAFTVAVVVSLASPEQVSDDGDKHSVVEPVDGISTEPRAESALQGKAARLMQFSRDTGYALAVDVEALWQAEIVQPSLKRLLAEPEIATLLEIAKNCGAELPAQAGLIAAGSQQSAFIPDDSDWLIAGAPDLAKLRRCTTQPLLSTPGGDLLGSWRASKLGTLEEFTNQASLQLGSIDLARQVMARLDRDAVITVLTNSDGIGFFSTPMQQPQFFGASIGLGQHVFGTVVMYFDSRIQAMTAQREITKRLDDVSLSGAVKWARKGRWLVSRLELPQSTSKDLVRAVEPTVRKMLIAGFR